MSDRVTSEINSCPQMSQVWKETRLNQKKKKGHPTGHVSEGSLQPLPTHRGSLFFQGARNNFSCNRDRKGEHGRKRRGRGRQMMDGLCETSTSFSSPHVASLYMPFRVPNLTFSGERTWNSQTPPKRFSVAAAAWGNLTGTKSQGSSQTQKAQIVLFPWLLSCGDMC